mmetsp:Transcript_34527/g.75566  ORF Transcript_34527/g.75566 Transcript_34527/m.75566 type:complete len:507 (-) Transcript_34527:1295-2815(-)
MTAPTHEVKLAIYDLSHGLARSLSAQFLGPNHSIDIIPHTSILAFGKEYYFGGGIQFAAPNEFRAYSGLAPIEVQSLGRSTVAQSQFEAWCASVASSGEFAPESYDLLRRNCNNFSQEAATRGLGLSRGVPQWILDVPARFLASPMGQMIRPVLEGMQLSGPGAVGGAGGGDVPFSAASTPFPAPAASATAMGNPWANIVETPIIDAHNKPLLSADTNTIKICTSKLLTAAGDDAASNIPSSFDELAIILNDPQSSVSHEVLEHTVPFLLKNLEQRESSKSTLLAVYSLMLLRLVVLHPADDGGARIVLSEVISIIGGRLIGTTDESKGEDTLFESHTVRSMAWCTISNASGTIFGSSFLRTDPALRNGLIDAALSDTSTDHSQRAEVRQSALTFLYNIAHDITTSTRRSSAEELPDTSVTLLCSMLEGLDEETNPTARLRRLLIAAKILKPSNGKSSQVDEAAKGLVADLGFADAIAHLRDVTIGEGGDARMTNDLAAEVCLILS